MGLLKTASLSGAVVNGNTIFAQAEICHVIIHGGDYFLTVDDNQPALRADIALPFGEVSPLSAPWAPPLDLACVETIGKEHGRIEARTLHATASLTAYLAPLWPGVAQVCRLTVGVGAAVKRASRRSMPSPA